MTVDIMHLSSSHKVGILTLLVIVGETSAHINTLHFVMTNIDNLETACSALLDNACKNYPETFLKMI